MPQQMEEVLQKSVLKCFQESKNTQTLIWESEIFHSTTSDVYVHVHVHSLKCPQMKWP